jgi:hypothetical protein
MQYVGYEVWRVALPLWSCSGFHTIFLSSLVGLGVAYIEYLYFRYINILPVFRKAFFSRSVSEEHFMGLFMSVFRVALEIRQFAWPGAMFETHIAEMGAGHCWNTLLKRIVIAVGTGAIVLAQPWGWRQYVPPKRWYPLTSPHGITAQKTTMDAANNCFVSLICIC